MANSEPISILAQAPALSPDQCPAVTAKIPPILRIPPELHFVIGTHLKNESDFQCYRLTCKHLFALLPPPGLRLPQKMCNDILINRGFNDNTDYLVFLGNIMRDMDRAKRQELGEKQLEVPEVPRTRKYTYKYYRLCRSCQHGTWIMRAPTNIRPGDRTDMCIMCYNFYTDPTGITKNTRYQVQCNCGNICKVVDIGFFKFRGPAQTDAQRRLLSQDSLAYKATPGDQ